MLFGIFFAFWRFMEIITLVSLPSTRSNQSTFPKAPTNLLHQIPTLGMLAFFVHIYASHNALTPNYILILFIVSVLGAVWAICTLFTYHRAKSNALFVSFIAICFVGAFIAGVYELRFISHANCTNVTSGQTWDINFGVVGVCLSPFFHPFAFD